MNPTDSDKKNNHPTNTRTKITLVVVSVLVALAGVEIAVRIAAPCPIPEHRLEAPQKLFFQYDALLGWRGKPGVKGRFCNLGFDTYVEHDSVGFRNANPPHVDGKRNVIVIGDSFGWGWGVDNDQLFSQAMMRDDKSLNVYNLSAPGYGTGQELLVLQEFFSANPDKHFDNVVLLFYPGNDYDDVSASVRYSYPKPVFENDNGTLLVTNIPVPEKIDVFATDETEQLTTGGSAMERVLRSSHAYNRIVELRHAVTKMEAVIDSQIRAPKPDVVDLAHRLVVAIGEEATARSAKFSVIVITRQGSSGEQANAQHLLTFLKEVDIPHAHYDFDINCSLCIDSHINAKGHGQIARLARWLLDATSPLE